MAGIYVGRMVMVGLTPTGKLAVMYRVSSRSFPNRQARIENGKVMILPKVGFENDVFKNPYITYNCAVAVNRTAILTNGSQTDPIAEKISTGMSIRDALAFSLATLDYERDAYNTPRIAAAARLGEKNGWLAIAQKDGLEIRAVPLSVGKCNYLATYEHNAVRPEYVCQIPFTTAEAACRHLLGEGDFRAFTNPVTAVAAVESENNFTLSALTAAPVN